MAPNNPLNIVQQEGYLVASPEIREYSPGRFKAVLDLAQTRFEDERDSKGYWKKAGETEFFRYEAFGKCVDAVRDLKKGQDVLLGGGLSQDRSQATGNTYTKLLLWVADALPALNWSDFQSAPPPDPLSKFVLQCRLTKEVQPRATDDGLAGTISLALNRFSNEKDDQGRWKAFPPQFFHPEVYDKVAEKAASFSKGNELMVSGELRMGRSASNHTYIRMIATEIEPVLLDLTKERAQGAREW